MNKYLVAFEPRFYGDLLRINQVVRKLVFRDEHDCEILRNLLIIKSQGYPEALLKFLSNELPNDRFLVAQISHGWLGHNVMSSDDCERVGG